MKMKTVIDKRRSIRVGGRKPRPPDYRGEPGCLRVLAGEYIDWMLVRNYAPRSAETRENHLQDFLQWCDERSLTQPMEVTQPILERYQRWLYYFRTPTGRPMGMRTQHMRLVSVREFFRWLTRTRRTLFNPAAELELPKVEKRLPRDVLTAEEVELVLRQADVTDALGLRDRAIMETLYSTGMRRMEAANLKIHDLDVARGTVLIQQGKGRKDRVCPIGARALAWIEKYITDVRPLLAMEPDDGYIFLTVDGKSFASPVGLSGVVRKYMKQAGTGKVGGCHMFRHAAATQMLENGVDIRFIQELLGHVKLETTQIYTRVSIQKLKEIHQAAHPAERSWRERGATRAPDAAVQELLDALAAEAEEGDGEPHDP